MIIWQNNFLIILPNHYSALKSSQLQKEK